MIRNALSIDLEDWFHAELIRPHAGERPVRRVAEATEPILALLERYGVRATFFVVGEVLRDHPQLVRRIYERGHEVGCHGWSHRPLWALDRAGFIRELEAFDREAAKVLPVEEVVGFRAPTFSLDERTAWALEVLRERGFRYDASLFPVRNGLYGVARCPERAYCPAAGKLTVGREPGGDDLGAGELVELPMTAVRLAGLRVPVSGGFYLRATPWPLLKALAQRVNAEGRPFVLYLHPWEADAGTPRVGGLSPLERLATYYNSGSVLPKLEALVRSFALAPLRQVLGIEGGRRVI